MTDKGSTGLAPSWGQTFALVKPEAMFCRTSERRGGSPWRGFLLISNRFAPMVAYRWSWLAAGGLESREFSVSAEIRPYRISVGDDVLDDLKSRLRRTRWPEAELGDDWSQGAPLKWIKDVCRYWAEDYDWRDREARLNRFAQFTTEIDGLDSHFLHVRSPHPDAMTLIITHGWPGSVVEFNKVIEPLTDPSAHGG